MALQPGEILRQRYLIKGQLGRGGMGTVYLAIDQALQIPVAVKENLNLDPVAERQFRREAELLANLRHPNLPRVTDHFTLEERQYLVMDFIEGKDLHIHANQQPPTIEEVLSWADAVCDALIYLHSQQPPVIHRDIKPANLKLQPDGTVILVDFGIAKLFDHAQTSTGARGLTPGFSPPEQYGSQRTDTRSDQYSLASTIYFLLTGQRPVDSIERMIKKTGLKPARSQNPAIPKHIDAALNRALALDQDDRFPDIKSFQAALHGQFVAEPLLKDTLPSDHPDARMGVKVAKETRLQTRPRRSRLSPWVVIVAMSLLVVGGGAAIVLTGIWPGNQSQATPTTSVPIVLPPEASATPITTPTTPSYTNTPSPTVEPSLTPSPTITSTPSPIPIGGGGRIAFVSDRDERVFQIWTMNPDGTDQRQLTFGPGDKSQPKWSPDGTRLLYVSHGGVDIYGNNLGLDIKIINADGTDINWVIHSQGDDTDPAWSPDGSQIAFASTRSGNANQIFVLDASCLDQPDLCVNEKPERISCTVDFCPIEWSPVWAPEGITPPTWMPADHNLAVAVSINGAPAKIFFRSPESEDRETIDFDKRDHLVGVDHLDWSPDGTSMLFTWTYQRGANEITVVPLVERGFGWERLTNSLGNKEPAFSPDGKYIVFTSSRDQNFEIYVMTSGGQGQTNITNSPTSRDIQPDWQPLGD